MTAKKTDFKRLMKRFTIVLNCMLLAGVVLTACATSQYEEWENEPQRSTESRPHLIGPGDKVRITVFRDEDLSGTYGVDSSGRISMPLVGGIEVRGQTIPEFERAITEQLSRNQLSNPIVSIEMVTSRPFCIFGQVNKPDCYELIPEMKGADAIATAGGYTYRAKENRLLITGEDGKKLLGDHDTPIFPGDTIEIVERYF